MKTVVLGGYGNFGARICRALARDPCLSLVVAGRDQEKAQALASQLGVQAAVVDSRSAALAQRLQGLGAQLLIHTAGPFQEQGYAVAQAAALAGCHYIDLADGRRFVCDFAQVMDGAFRAAARVGIAGASTVPALSSAVVDALAAHVGQVQGIDVCIAPAQRAPRGEATIAGVLSYCGAPVQVWRGGRWQPMAGWSDLAPIRFARLKPRLGALCDIPDLELFVRRYADVQDVMFRAALEVGLTQRGFAALAWLHRRGLLARPQRLAGVLHRAGGALDWLGSADGGMVVRVRGTDAGRCRRLAWHITAPNHHGPEIPCMPAILLARKLARGHGIEPGASACVGMLGLADFEPEFQRWGMATEIHEEPVP